MSNTTISAITAAALLAAGSVVAAPSNPADEAPEGVYSADQLLAADVYAKGGNEQIGEVDDLVLDNNMTIRSFVVEAEGNFGLGGKSYVVPTDHVRVRAAPGDEAKEPDYTVVLDMNAKQLGQQPVYSNSWWNQTQQHAQTAWQQTKQGADSAWTQIKQGATSAYQGAKGALHSAAEHAADATDGG